MSEMAGYSAHTDWTKDPDQQEWIAPVSPEELKAVENDHRGDYGPALSGIADLIASQGFMSSGLGVLILRIADIQAAREDQYMNEERNAFDREALAHLRAAGRLLRGEPAPK